MAKQRELIHQLCNAEERSVIYRMAKADGYLSASNGFNLCLEGWDPIFEYGYRYAECTAASVTSHVLPDNAEIYRFTLEPEGHRECGTGEKRLADYSRLNYRGNSPSYKDTNYGNNYKKNYKAKLKGKCLVVKKVDKPKSSYMVLYEHVYNDEGKEYSIDEINRKYKGNYRDKRGVISIGRQKVVDMSSGELLSQYNDYAFFPNSMVWVTSRTFRCDTELAPLAPNEVLVPVKNQE